MNLKSLIKIKKIYQQYKNDNVNAVFYTKFKLQ